MRGRAASLVLPRQRTPDPAFEHIHEPGGFRRNYVLMRATERGGEEPLVLNNFIEFLYIFGHFVCTFYVNPLLALIGIPGWRRSRRRRGDIGRGDGY